MDRAAIFLRRQIIMSAQKILLLDVIQQAKNIV
jgi:hypothetical protein